MKNRKLPTLEEFKEELKKHTFSMIYFNGITSGYPFGTKEALMARFVEAQATEANLIFPDAWAGGDAYMEALGEAQALAIKTITDEAIRQEPKHYLEVKVYSKLDPELRAFIEKLDNHDWYYDYSDDINMSRRGSRQRSEIDALIKTGGDEYRLWYNRLKPNNFNTL